jgi:trans-aconitate methyltransferase
VSESPSQATEWDAGAYHRIATPQATWGVPVLDRLPLAGTETVVDAGCGSGTLTARLLERLPSGRVIAVDRSANMLRQAAELLTPRFGNRVAFVQADVGRLRLDAPVDAIFSTATFHWVCDHPALFRALFAALRPGGRLVAQCGGGANIAVLRARAARLMADPRYRAAPGWTDPWEFATPDVTAERLRAAGFGAVRSWLEPKPTPFPDAAAYREFLRAAVLPAHLDALPDEATRAAFLDELTALAAADDPPFILDYWRLNLDAARPTAR